MEKDLEVSLLMDFYGELLTPRQRDAINSYYNDDLSLSEISLNMGITRQGVQDCIKKAVSILYKMEKKLGLHLKSKQINVQINKIKQLSESILLCVDKNKNSENIILYAQMISKICDSMVN